MSPSSTAIHRTAEAHLGRGPGEWEALAGLHVMPFPEDPF